MNIIITKVDFRKVGDKIRTWRWKLLFILFRFCFCFLNQCMFKFAKVMKIIMIPGKIVYVNTKIVVVGNISRLCED